MRFSDLPNSHRVNAFLCLHCGKSLHGVCDTGGSFQPPREGDFSFCTHCGNIAVFTVTALGYALRDMTGDELLDFEELAAQGLAPTGGMPPVFRRR